VPVGILHLAAAFAVFRAEAVAQDREEPRLHVGARLERVDIRNRAHQGFLHEIVRAIDVAAERNREGAKLGHNREDRLHGRRVCH